MQVQAVVHAGASGSACRWQVVVHAGAGGNMMNQMAMFCLGERVHPLRHWSGASDQVQATMNFC